MKYFFGIILSSVFLSACVATTEQSPTEQAPADKQSTEQSPSEAPKSEDPIPVTPTIASSHPTMVTVTQKAADTGPVNNDQSVVAKCKLVGQNFRTEVETPAHVSLPTYGKGTPPLTMTCTYGGKEYSKTFKVVNISAHNRAAAAIGVGIVCPLCAVQAGATIGVERPGDLYAFTGLNIEVR